MNDLQEEIDFLKGEIASLRGRIGTGGNEVQKHKLAMLNRLLLRCEASQKLRAR